MLYWHTSREVLPWEFLRSIKNTLTYTHTHIPKPRLTCIIGMVTTRTGRTFSLPSHPNPTLPHSVPFRASLAVNISQNHELVLVRRLIRDGGQKESQSSLLLFSNRVCIHARGSIFLSLPKKVRMFTSSSSSLPTKRWLWLGALVQVCKVYTQNFKSASPREKASAKNRGRIGWRLLDYEFNVSRAALLM